jgi:hypothetical protein
MRALQPVRPRLQISMLLGNRRAHRLQTLNMQINRPPANRASPGHCDARHAGPRNQRPQHQRARAHGLHDLVLRHRIAQHCAPDRRPMLRAPIPQLHLRAHRHQQLALRLDVLHLRNILEDDLILRKNRSSHAGQRRVLRPGNLDCAKQGIAPANNELIHLSSVDAHQVRKSACTPGVSPHATL